MSGPLPELLCGRRDRPAGGVWHVEIGAARRGDAWTDLQDLLMRAPFAGGEHGRLIRAHELMHARVSPIAPALVDVWDDLHPRAVECAEEFRVNLLLTRAGFDLGELRDGSETLTGERLAAAAAWEELAFFSAALCGSRALGDLVRGVRRVSPEWAKACRTLERELRRAVRRWSTDAVAATLPDDNGLPLGFARHTRRLAEIVDAWGRHGPQTATRRSGRPRATGVFAPIVLDTSVELDRVVRGGFARTHARAAWGRRVVRPDRIVTDPARRVFEQPTRGCGGVVVVDQSGSMSIAASELAALLAAAPGALVVGYSHAPGTHGVPNAWVLADRGLAASAVRPGNVGNGVDGPAIRYALARRRGAEPVLWVTDGQVTDSADHADMALAGECARLVLRHGIRMVRSVAEAIERLRAGRAPSGQPRLLGRVAAAVTADP